MKKMLIALMSVMITVSLLGIGTYAYFSDTETSKGNIFTAGTLDLKLSNDKSTWKNGVTTTWESPDGWAPGESFDAKLHLKNTGTVDAKVILLKFEEGGIWNEEFAKNITVDIADYRYPGWYYTGKFQSFDGSLESLVNDDFFAGWNFIMDYANTGGSNPTISGTYLPADGEAWIALRFTFSPDAENDLQGAKTSFKLTLAALQYPEDTITVDEIKVRVTGDVTSGW